MDSVFVRLVNGMMIGGVAKEAGEIIEVLEADAKVWLQRGRVELATALDRGNVDVFTTEAGSQQLADAVDEDSTTTAGKK